jgi:AcrR family transcriptional regulator
MADGITRADITGAALALLADGGLHALAMRRIAAELGVQQSALYWHFDNKQQLLAAVADLVVAPVEPTNARKWQNRILGLGSRLRDELLRYPDGAELVATAIAFRLGAGRPHQLFADELVRAGMSDDDAGVAASVLVHFVVGYTTDEQQHHQAAALGAIDRVEAATGRFEQGLRLIVAGVESQIATAGAP